MFIYSYIYFFYLFVYIYIYLGKIDEISVLAATSCFDKPSLWQGVRQECVSARNFARLHKDAEVMTAHSH